MSAYPNSLTTARRQATSQICALLNNELKEICRHEALAVSGTKAVLQQRILNHLDACMHSSNIEGFDRVRQLIVNHGKKPPVPNATAKASSTLGQHHSGSDQTVYAANRPSLPPPHGFAARPAPVTRLNFRPSPFFHVQEHLTPVQDLQEMPSNRHTMETQIVLSASVCERVKSDSSLRIMMYCTTSSLLHAYEQSEVAFPGQIEVRVNQDEVKSNYKGLKNKPGTTKPADLTNYLRKSAGYSNTLQVNYALTNKRYSYVICLVRKSSVKELADRIRNGKIISREKVLEEMADKARDPDIEATSSTVSLKDPISTMRMELPCRSTICTHVQCFDAVCYIQLQEQAPTWACPICNRTISYETLAVDHYFLDILNKTSKNVEQVTVEPKGEWHEVKQAEDALNGTNRPARAAYDDDSDDDVLEIADTGGPALLKHESATNLMPAFNFHMTPPLSSREASVTTQQVSSANRSKRQSAVIDLTASDEDEEPVRGPKRHNPGYLTTPTSTTNMTPPSMSIRQTHSAGPAPPRPVAQTLYSGFAQMHPPPTSPSTTSATPEAEMRNRNLPFPQNFAHQSGSPWLGSQYQNRH